MSRRREIQVGITVLLAIGILLWGVTWLKELTFQRSVRVWRVSFPQAGGLGASDEVQVNGIRKGSIRSIRLIGDRVLVELALAAEVELTRASRVVIRNVGLMGEKLIAVDLRHGGGAWSTADTIPGVFERGIPEVMADLGDAVGAISQLTGQLQALADALNEEAQLAGAVRNFRVVSEQLRAVVEENRSALRTTLADFSAAARTARALTTDREIELRQAMDHFAEAAERMNRLAVRVDSLRASLHAITHRVESGDGTLGRLVQDETLYNDVNAAVKSFRDLVQDIKANPRKYLKVHIF